jgi:signal transduction histidine kinase
MLQTMKNRWLGRPLAGKLAITVMMATMIIVPAIFVTIWLSSSRVFLDIESQTITAQTARAQNAMRVFEKSLSGSVADYANWDDSYTYLSNPSKAFEDSTLNPLTFSSMGVDVVTYVSFDQKVVFQRVVDNKTSQVLGNESAVFGKLTSTGAFFEVAKAKQNHQAYVRTDRGLYLLYSQWQSDSTGEAKPSGFIVMGNLIAPKMLSDALQSDARLNLDLGAPLAQAIVKNGKPSVSALEDETIKSGLGLHGQDNKLLAVVEFDTPRSLMIAGREALTLLAISLLTGLSVLILCLWLAARQIVVRRIQSLQTFVKDYHSHPEMPAHLAAVRDELGMLARAFDHLSGELRDAKKELTQKSYLQGKADSAAGMLHNVRNALAPIRVTQEKWLREDTLPFRQNMLRAAEELAEDDLAADRRSSLENFMITAARQIALAHDGRIAEMQETKESVDQLAAILGGYNFNTSAETAGEEVDFLKVLRQEIRVLDSREGANVNFSLPETMPAMIGNALHLAQVIGNVLVNADEAMNDAGVSEKRIQVSCAPNAEGMVEVRLKDNGDGIPAENMTNIFQRSFSTRTHKAGGIGLHWSANAMRAMGGSIRLVSEGVGQGATAVLTLRLAKDMGQMKKQAA